MSNEEFTYQLNVFKYLKNKLVGYIIISMFILFNIILISNFANRCITLVLISLLTIFWLIITLLILIPLIYRNSWFYKDKKEIAYSYFKISLSDIKNITENKEFFIVKLQSSGKIQYRNKILEYIIRRIPAINKHPSSLYIQKDCLKS